MYEKRLKELTDIYINPLAFLKFVRIQEPGELALQYELWSHLIEFYLALELSKLILVIKSKQIGISWALAIRAVRKIMTVPGSNILMLSSGEKEAQSLLEKAQIVYRNLPEWLKQCDWGSPNTAPKYFTLDPNSSERFGIKEMGSMITALASTEKAGIGQTSDWVIHDEAEFHDFFEINLGHTLATVADNPKRKLTVVSTLDKTKPDSYFKRLYKGAKGSGYPEAGSNNFQALFLPYDVRPGRDEHWYEEEKRSHIDKPWEMEANYPRNVKEALAPLSAQSCFNKERLDKLWEMRIEPEIRQGFIYILCPPRVGTQYVAGTDVGGGVGLDYSCTTIIGKQGLSSEVAAVIYTNTLATDLFAYETDKLCREYFKCLLGVENNAMGIAVTDKLLELGYPNLYYNDKEQKRVGWVTGDKSKHTGIAELVQVVDNGSLIIRFLPMIQEMMEYQWLTVRGAYKPMPTGKTHGDLVISVMIANQMLKRVGTSRKASLYVDGRKIW